MFFRGNLFPPKSAWQWFKLIARNRASVYRIVRESFTQWHGANGAARHSDFPRGTTYAPRNPPRAADAGQEIA